MANPVHALADLRNEQTFPTFAGCPEREVNLDFYEAIDDKFLKPKYHWCLIAEILHIKAPRLDRLIVRDQTGTELPVFMYSSGRDDEIGMMREDLSRCNLSLKVGHCVAILYPHRQDFRFGVGIRVEVKDWVKVIPCTMTELLALNDRVQEQDVSVGGKRACHACGKRDETLMKCGRCNLCWYCDGICQQVGWNEKGHKEDCKILKDKDIQGMFFLNWNHYDSSLDFSVPQKAA